jgi:hypothetical protein
LALLVSLDHVGFSSSRVGQDENGLLLVLFLQHQRQMLNLARSLLPSRSMSSQLVEELELELEQKRRRRAR